jgi:hypothetical protein
MRGNVKELACALTLYCFAQVPERGTLVPKQFFRSEVVLDASDHGETGKNRMWIFLLDMAGGWCYQSQDWAPGLGL